MTVNNSLYADMYNAAMIKFLTGLPFSSGYTIHIDGFSLGAQFPTRNCGYIPVSPGLHQASISVHAGTPANRTENLELSSGKFYTLAVARSRGTGKLLIFEDEPGVPAGEAKIRFIHLYPQEKELDIAVKKRDVIFPDVQYGQSTPYLGITPMSLELEARKPGAKGSAIALPLLTFEHDTAYTIVLAEGETHVIKDTF
ncbi:DUF4397 domain-containing protein [Bacillus sp. FJAT-27251]|uniref:DUF4397 domain-containing protein n=1 Tax=Bacillus sp. FJAT-27251 TaxID=1684142 RepID=UPI0006A76258|nr:DUF4397 domain-containing protein [Bacillus sp. FJAT-27251]